MYFWYKYIIDRHLIAAARKLAKPGTFVVDVGANIGFFSMAIACRANVNLLAFEPHHQNYKIFNEVIAGSTFGSRIHPYMLALSDRTGIGLLYLSNLASTDHKLINSRSSKAVEIAITRLDDFFLQHAELAKKPISLVKIDVQGAELLVLRGMQQTLKANNFPPILVEYAPDDLAQAGVTAGEFFDAFESLGYRPHTLPDLSPQHSAWFMENMRDVYLDLAMIHSGFSVKWPLQG